MNYCQKCGRQLDPNAFACPGCGAPVSSSNNQSFNITPNNYGNPADSSSFGYALLGFCIPIVGLILFLVWKDTTPLRARSAGKGALFSVIASVIFYILYFIFMAVIFSTMGY